MKTEAKQQDADELDQVQADNAALREEITRLREHMEIQTREIAALQAENGRRGGAGVSSLLPAPIDGKPKDPGWTEQLGKLESAWAQIKSR
jgi:hypothetical protein